MSAEYQSSEGVFVPTHVAAKNVGYTSDYVSKLARDGKVDARRDGRQWFVDVASLQNFASTAREEKEERNQTLREERIRERIESGIPYISSFDEPVKKVRALSSILSTTAIVTAGLLVGVVVYSTMSGISKGTFSFNPYSFLANVLGVDDGAAGGEGVGKSEGVVLLSENEGTKEQLNSIRNSFSDEVNVSFDGRDTGIVTPVFKESEGEAYRFLLVPIRTDS